jgi:DNA-3-methyladenine glycosylase II
MASCDYGSTDELRNKRVTRYVVSVRKSDMQEAVAQLQRDPVMAGIIERIGPCDLSYREPQQISSKVARVFKKRLLDRMPDGVITPEAILRMRVTTFRKIGLSAAKTEYIRDLARKTISGELALERFPEMPDEEVIEHLVQVKGIGVWTAHMFLLFALRRPDVLPIGDLGIRAAMKRAYELPELPKPAEMERIAANWRPWCSVACWYLWRSLDDPGEMV